MKRFLTVSAATALALGGGLLAAQPAQAATDPSYSVMLLQPVVSRGGTNSVALGVNAAGDVVGYSQGGSLYHGASFWKARSAQATALAPLQYDGTALDVAASGNIIATMPMADAFWYNPDATTEDFAITSDGPLGATHISENGAVPVNSNVLGDSTPYLAKGPTNVTELQLPSGTSNGWVTGISDDGRHVAGSVEFQGSTVAALWSNTMPKRFQSPATTTSSRLEAVNNSGIAVGCSMVGSAERPYRYTASGAPTALPALAGYAHTCATVINNAGVAAGTASQQPTAESGNGAAVVWVNGQARNLNDLVAQRSGYTLMNVADINASGQIIGTAVLTDGTSRGYIATPTNGENVYTTPGLHELNDRQWRTTCEPYSQTTRCRTEIWANTVSTSNGRHTMTTGWAFNNLTYVASPRELWAQNPLGRNGTWTADDGRQWRTECDTAATGRHGCRSHAKVTVVSATANPGGGYTFTSENKWVFNNIVKFTSN